VRGNDFTTILGWPGYRVYRHEIDEGAKRLRLWVRRQRRARALICSGCGERIREVHDVSERDVRDLPWGEYRTTVVVEIYRVRCPDCGVRIERVAQLPSKAPFSKRFEDAMGLACEAASARQVSRQWGVSASTVRAIDLRSLERWAARPPSARPQADGRRRNLAGETHQVPDGRQ
jgi:transposase